MTKFLPEFRQTVIESVCSGEIQTEVAKSLRISSKTVHAWWSATKQELPTQELTNTEEMARLRRLLCEREAEIAFLKIIWRLFVFTRYDEDEEPKTSHLDCVAFFGALSPLKNCSLPIVPILLCH